MLNTDRYDSTSRDSIPDIKLGINYKSISPVIQLQLQL